jgi:uncharacterized protein with PQ loop repeat
MRSKQQHPAHGLIGAVRHSPIQFLARLLLRPGDDNSLPTMLIGARPNRPKRERAMRLEDFTLALFAACNFIRLFAYLPQIYKAATDKNGASAISYTTWGLFLIAHLSTIAYALVNRSDWWLAVCFAGNAVCCIAILAVAYRRSVAHARALHLAATSLPGARRSLSEYIKRFLPVRIGSTLPIVRDGSRR